MFWWKLKNSLQHVVLSNPISLEVEQRRSSREDFLQNMFEVILFWVFTLDDERTFLVKVILKYELSENSEITGIYVNAVRQVLQCQYQMMLKSTHWSNQSEREESQFVSRKTIPVLRMTSSQIRQIRCRRHCVPDSAQIRERMVQRELAARTQFPDVCPKLYLQYSDSLNLVESVEVPNNGTVCSTTCIPSKPLEIHRAKSKLYIIYTDGLLIVWTIRVETQDREVESHQTSMILSCGKVRVSARWGWQRIRKWLILSMRNHDKT